MTYKKTFPSDWATRKGQGWELFLPRNVILWFQFPGTTEECGNRIHGGRLYVANIPELSKCINKQSTSWWHRNYEAETIIITHVRFYSPLTRDTSNSQDSRATEKELIPLAATKCILLYASFPFFFFFLPPTKVKPSHYLLLDALRLGVSSG